MVGVGYELKISGYEVSFRKDKSCLFEKTNARRMYTRVSIRRALDLGATTAGWNDPVNL